MPMDRFHTRHITILDGHRSQLLSERSAVRTDLFKALAKLLVPAIGAALVLVAIRAFLEQATTFRAQADKATIFSRQQHEPAGDKSVMSQMGKRGPTLSAPAPTDVRYATESDPSRAEMQNFGEGSMTGTHPIVRH